MSSDDYKAMAQQIRFRRRDVAERIMTFAGRGKHCQRPVPHLEIRGTTDSDDTLFPFETPSRRRLDPSGCHARRQSSGKAATIWHAHSPSRRCRNLKPLALNCLAIMGDGDRE
jgi:hypothetical protein